MLCGRWVGYRYEVDREFKTELFKQRISTFYNLLKKYSEIHADGVIDEEEKAQMQDLARSISLIASSKTVNVLSNYVNGICATGNLYLEHDKARQYCKSPGGTTMKDEHLGTFRNLVACMRSDLKVVQYETGKETDVKTAVESIVKPRD